MREANNDADFLGAVIALSVVGLMFLCIWYAMGIVH